jgi:hypothetical protein
MSINCGGCGKQPGTPLRCGVCKIVTYCSAECQRSDWPFHKRNCKSASASASAASNAAASSTTTASAASSRPTAASHNEKEEGELDWYRHREWRPSDKREFVPVKLQDGQPATLKDEKKTGSAWNAADTWEEKDMTTWAKQWIQDNLSQSPDKKISNIIGDASVCFVRGKLRYLFDFEFTINGDIKISDFCDHEEFPTIKLPKNHQQADNLKQWLTDQRTLFVKTYQQTVL